MFDHFGFVVRDLAESLRFYEACLTPLGLRIAERHGNEAVIISGAGEFPCIWMGISRPEFWGEEHGAARSPFHLASRPHREKPWLPFTKRASDMEGEITEHPASAQAAITLRSS
jgi:catechol 2,3-dioxygenase-like lactoylglutathione lyase family enzyme